MEDKPAAVSEKARRAGDTYKQQRWVELSVWTDGMLKALKRGVKGGKWYSLIDKVWKEENLLSAWRRVKANAGQPGIDYQTIDDYERHLETNLKRLSRRLREGSYEPKAVKRCWIPKPGRAEKRPLGIPCVEDRIVQTAIMHVVEPIFERDFAEHSYGFRPNRGCKDALRRVHRLLEEEGKVWVVDADIKGYFDAIDHGRLMEKVEEEISDGRLLELIRMFLNQEIVDEDERWTARCGTPQGGVISPLLANIYLDPLDHLMAEQGFEMVRYADDFVVLCDSEAEAEQALRIIEDWTMAAKLTLHPDKTQLVDARQKDGFVFLGYRFERGMKFPSDKSLAKFKDAIRQKTRRVDGRSLATIIEDLNESIRGWFEYFKHAFWNIFEDLDGWIRKRLRAILRRRKRIGGHTNNADHARWPNAFFADAGLFSMVTARQRIIESLRKG